jgi:hypothetical protein
MGNAASCPFPRRPFFWLASRGIEQKRFRGEHLPVSGLRSRRTLPRQGGGEHMRLNFSYMTEEASDGFTRRAGLVKEH